MRTSPYTNKNLIENIFLLSYLLISIVKSASVIGSSSSSSPPTLVQCSQESNKAFFVHQGFTPSLNDGLSNGTVILLSTLLLENSQNNDAVACQEECCHINECNIAVSVIEMVTNTSDNQSTRRCALYKCQSLQMCQLVTAAQDTVTYLLKKTDADISTSTEESVPSTTPKRFTSEGTQMSTSTQLSDLKSLSTATDSNQVDDKPSKIHLTKSTEDIKATSTSRETIIPKASPTTSLQYTSSDTTHFSSNELSVSDRALEGTPLSLATFDEDMENEQTDISGLDDVAQESKLDDTTTLDSVKSTAQSEDNFSAEIQENSKSTGKPTSTEIVSKKIELSTDSFDIDHLQHVNEAMNSVAHHSNSKAQGNHVFLTDEERMAKDKTTMAALLLALIIGIGFMVTVTILFLRRCGDGNSRRIRYTRIDHLMNAP
jgi:hypothetical protein